MKNLVPLLIAGIGTARETQVEQSPSHSHAQGSFEALLARELGKGEHQQEVSPLEGEMPEEEDGESTPMEFLSAAGLLSLVQPGDQSIQESAAEGEGVEPVLVGKTSEPAPALWAPAEAAVQVEAVDQTVEFLDGFSQDLASQPRLEDTASEPHVLEMEGNAVDHLVRMAEPPPNAEPSQELQGSPPPVETGLNPAAPEVLLDRPELPSTQPEAREGGNFEPHHLPRLAVREQVQQRETASAMPLDELPEQEAQLNKVLAEESSNLGELPSEMDILRQEASGPKLQIQAKAQAEPQAPEELPETEEPSLLPEDEVQPQIRANDALKRQDREIPERGELEESSKLTPPENRRAEVKGEYLETEPAPQVLTEPEQLAESQEPEAPLRPTLDVRERETLLPKLVQNLESLVTEERTEVRIQLRPEHLGELKIKLSVERGIMMAEFVVQNETVRGIIASQLAQLYTALEEQGTPLSQVMINIGLGERHAQEEQQSQTQARQSRAESTGGLGKLNAAAAPNYLGRSVWYQVDLRA